jgi:hypothetical protein
MERVRPQPPRRAARGLAEVTVVVLAMAVVAFFVPQQDRGQQESYLLTALYRTRRAITKFHTATGVYPVTLMDLAAPATDGTQVGATTVPAGTYKGPYLRMPPRNGQTGYYFGIGDTGIPANPMTVEDDLDITHHWTYNPADGTVISAIEGVTLDGADYTKL